MDPEILCDFFGCTCVVLPKCRWLNGANKMVSGSNTCIHDGIGDQSKVAVAGSSKGAGNGSGIGLDFLVEIMEAFVSGVASYFTDSRMIEVNFFVFDGFFCGGCGGQHVDGYF